MSDIVVFVADVGTALPSHSKDAAESSMAPSSPFVNHRITVTVDPSPPSARKSMTRGLVGWHVRKGYLQWHE